jgi:2-polyprenyl-6-methoxyphenol hydroxylase-like FAD-dependent oxidoreductase
MTDGQPTTVDAVVIGAGVAGSAAAIQLARAGWSVALVERQRFPRRKVCGECIAASNLPLLHDLGIGAAFDTDAGPALTRVALMSGDNTVIADLPAADNDRQRWGRALGRETLDTLLLEQARSAGALVLQPCALQTIAGQRGQWACEVRDLVSGRTDQLRSAVLIDAHGCWDTLPSDRQALRSLHRASDLLAFKANFSGSSLPAGTIAVLNLQGGYGGMVVAGGGITTVACCIRRDRLADLRDAAPGVRAGHVVEAFLRDSCAGRARGAVRRCARRSLAFRRSAGHRGAAARNGPALSHRQCRRRGAPDPGRGHEHGAAVGGVAVRAAAGLRWCRA